MKRDDAITLAIQWGVSILALLLLFILVFACYFTLPSVRSAHSAGTKHFSEERYVAFGAAGARNSQIKKSDFWSSIF